MPEDDKKAADEQRIKDAEAVLLKNKELKEELDREKADKKRIADERAKLAAEKEEAEKTKLKEKEDYKALSEKHEKEALEWKTKNETLAKGMVDAQKVGALATELDKLGILPDRKGVALGMCNLEELKYDDGTKVVTNAEAVAKSIMAKVPEIFGGDVEKLPNGGGEGGDKLPAKLTKEWYMGLSAADRKKHYPAFMKAQGHTVKR